jgi:hypothetical protein
MTRNDGKDDARCATRWDCMEFSPTQRHCSASGMRRSCTCTLCVTVTGTILRNAGPRAGIVCQRTKGRNGMPPHWHTRQLPAAGTASSKGATGSGVRDGERVARALYGPLQESHCESPAGFGGTLQASEPSALRHSGLRMVLVLTQADSQRSPCSLSSCYIWARDSDSKFSSYLSSWHRA